MLHPDGFIICLATISQESWTRSRAMTRKREQGKQLWSVHRGQSWMFYLLFLEGWWKVLVRGFGHRVKQEASTACVLSWTHSQDQDVGHTLFHVRMFVWRLWVWAWKAVMLLWRLSLASLAEADAYTQGREQTQDYCDIVLLCASEYDIYLRWVI